MRILLSASIVLFPATMAVGQDGPSYPDVYQRFGAPNIDALQPGQFITQSIDRNRGFRQPSNVPLSLQQTGLNTVNHITANEQIGNLEQAFSGTQDVRNSIVAGAIGALTNISQDGTNTANTIDGTTIEFAKQVMGPGAYQTIENSVQFGGIAGGISQTGNNLANVARAEYAIGVGIQEVQYESEQAITNQVNVAAGSNVADQIEQSGTNVGNMLIADRVDEVIRRFDGVQSVTNTVILNDGYRPRVTQSGNNIANFISAQSVGTISQVSTGMQTVTNQVLGPNGQEIRHSNFRQAEVQYMGTSNVVNLMIVAEMDGGGNDDEVAITQEATFDQTASGNGQQSQSGNVLVVSR